MQGSLRLLSTIALSASLLTACGRKKQEQAEAVPPVEQTPTSASEERRTSQTEGESSHGNSASVAEFSPQHPEIPVPADSPVAGASANVRADLAQSDAVYEAWFRKYNLDLNDPNMLDADPDGDGVSNRDEFMADTNPRDPKSHPTATAAVSAETHSGLKLKSYNEVRLPLLLESVEGQSAKIRRLDEGERIDVVHAGESVQGLGLKVERVQSRRMTDKHGAPVDASRVLLEDPATKEKTTLVKDMPARSASSYAVLTSDDGKKSITVRQGDTFTWPQEGGSTFKVIDLRADQAVLKEEGSGRMWTVSK